MKAPSKIPSRRCPRLGGNVFLTYCESYGESRLNPDLETDRETDRQTGGTEDGICRKIRDCWWEIFDIDHYIVQKNGPGIIKKLAAAKPPDKIGQLLFLVEQARRRENPDQGGESNPAR